VVVTVVDTLVVVEVVSDGESSLEPHAASRGVTASAALNPMTADHRRSPRQRVPSCDGDVGCCIVVVCRIFGCCMSIVLAAPRG
jgi:hypothetical protein